MSMIGSLSNSSSELIMVEANTLEMVIRSIIREELEIVVSAIKGKKPRTYSRQEVMAILHISQPTLDAKIRKGLIHPIKLGGRRVIFNADDIDIMVA